MRSACSVCVTLAFGPAEQNLRKMVLMVKY